jgi:hypothetical protein
MMSLEFDDCFVFGSMRFRLLDPYAPGCSLGLVRTSPVDAEVVRFEWIPPGGILVIEPDDADGIKAVDGTTHPLTILGVRDPVGATLRVEWICRFSGLLIAMVRWSFVVPDRDRPLFAVYEHYGRLFLPEQSVAGQVDHSQVMVAS